MGENLILGVMLKHAHKIGFFGFCKKNSLLTCRYFGFKSCTILTFMILLKSHVWEKSGSLVKYKNALGQSNNWRYNTDFLHAVIHLLKLQIADVILGGCGQACPDIPNEAFKISVSQKLMEV